jgi:hypothetical protein
MDDLEPGRDKSTPETGLSLAEEETMLVEAH